jgi:hypothetical protein
MLEMEFTAFILAVFQKRNFFLFPFCQLVFSHKHLIDSNKSRSFIDFDLVFLTKVNAQSNPYY